MWILWLSSLLNWVDILRTLFEPRHIKHSFLNQPTTNVHLLQLVQLSIGRGLPLVKMLLSLVLQVTWILGILELAIAYDSCKGNKQTLVIPDKYDKDVPDSFQTEYTTQVHFDYRIQRLRGVNEDRYECSVLTICVNYF